MLQEVEDALVAADRGEVLRRLEALKDQAGFSELASRWGPALAARDPQFFRVFLLRHLRADRHASIIRDLLRTVPPPLYTDLYAKVAREKTWQADVARVLGASDPLAALSRLDVPGMVLEPGLALALYREVGPAAGPFLRAHLENRFRWRKRGGPDFEPLRRAAVERGDEDLAWYLFREFADAATWAKEVRALAQKRVPFERLEAELARRWPSTLGRFDVSPLLEFLDVYGIAALPLVEQRVRHDPRLLAWAQKQGPEVYWRVFFVRPQAKAWTDSLQQILSNPGPDLEEALRLRTPPGRYHLRLRPDVALLLYQRSPAHFRRMLAAVPDSPYPAVWDAATGDEATLDLLSVGFLFASARNESRARTEADEHAARLIRRWDGMSGSTYVRHVATTLNSIADRWGWNSAFSASRVGRYLARREAAAWATTDAALADLIESPLPAFQALGLRLVEQATDPGPVVLACLSTLQGALLGAPTRRQRKLALKALEKAPHDVRIDTILEEAMALRERRSVDEAAMVALVRRQWKSR
jgi:hypothetical protein